MKRKALSLVLALAVGLLFSGCDGSAQPKEGSGAAAQEPSPVPEASPTLFHDLSTAEEDGFLITMGTLTGYNGPNSDIFIPEGVIDVVASLSKEGLHHDSGIRSAHFPSTIKNVGGMCFDECENLEFVEFLPGKDIVIAGAFDSCKNLTSVTLAEGIISITGFSKCGALAEIVFPEGVTEISGFNETGLTEVAFPESVTTINGFGSCELLADVTIENKDAVLDEQEYAGENGQPAGNWAFQNCPNLTIHAPAGGAVEAFAARHGIPFSPL